MTRDGSPWTLIPNEILDNLTAYTTDELRVIIGMHYVAQQRPGYRPALARVATFASLDERAFADALLSLTRRGQLDQFLDLPVETKR